MNANKTIRTAVIGAGSFGRHHLRILSKSAHAQLAGVVDVDPARAAAAASEYGCPVYATLAELAGKVDSAVVAVPTSAHADVGCALLENGIDVLVEKPIAVDLASAQRLVAPAASRPSGCESSGCFGRSNRYRSIARSRGLWSSRFPETSRSGSNRWPWRRKSRCVWRWNRFWKQWQIAAGRWCRALKDYARWMWRWTSLLKLKSAHWWSHSKFSCILRCLTGS